jgi:hypothetical protein
MTQSDNREPNKPSNDVKQSFAWGQLFAGSLIGGLAVWKLLHKMTNTEPSDWFAGLSRAYEEVRDFLMTPFDWIHWDLTDGDKNMLTLSAVAVAAAVRTSYRYPYFPIIPAFVLTVLLLMQWSGWLFPSSGWDTVVHSEPNTVFSVALHRWVAVFSIFLLGTLVAVPIVVLSTRRPDEPRPEHWFMLLSVAFTVVWGAALLLMNWATSS